MRPSPQVPLPAPAAVDVAVVEAATLPPQRQQAAVAVGAEAAEQPSPSTKPPTEATTGSSPRKILASRKWARRAIRPIRVLSASNIRRRRPSDHHHRPARMKTSSIAAPPFSHLAHRRRRPNVVRRCAAHPAATIIRRAGVQSQLSSKIILLVSDQGAVVSANRGASWSNWYTQPTAAMYHVTADNAFPLSPVQRPTGFRFRLRR